ncbi:MAG: LamG-like jellyroll fold domain-containing protein [Bacteroidota bacterium]
MMNKKILFSLIGVLLAFPFFSIAQLDSGLVAYYPLNGDADAYIGSSDGVVFGPALAEDRFGLSYGAYEFDGENDYIDFGDAPEFQFTTDYSISIWIYFDGTVQDGAILQKRQNITPFAMYSLNMGHSPQNYVPDDFVFFQHREDGFNASSVLKYVASPEDSLSVGWHHIVITNEINGRATLYVDNKVIGTSESGPGNVQISTYPLLVGGSIDPPGTPNNFFKGKMDDIRLYNRALSLGEVSDLFATGFGPELYAGQVEIWPNPAKGKVKISSPEAAITSVELFDIAGRKLRFHTEMERFSVELTTEYQGLTFLKVMTNKGVVLRKLVFEE